jgi:hypothetical protein
VRAERSGKLDNTLIIISSDNGPWYLGNAGDHRGRKGNTFEGGMRVPFIAHWRAAFSGGRVETAMAFSVPQKEWLFDLSADGRESYDTADRHPARLDRLRAAYEAKVSEMEVNKRGWVKGI